MDRRDFLKSLLSSSALLGSSLSIDRFLFANDISTPNLILIRFGGGVRRKETINPKFTYAPYFCNKLLTEGLLYSNMTIRNQKEIESSHEQGTFRILTGNYQKKTGAEGGLFDSHYQSLTPTLFESFRKQWQLPEHKVLMINNEDRIQEEFFTFSKDTEYGLPFKGHALSLYRFKIYVLRKKLAAINSNHEAYEAINKKLSDLEKFSKVINHEITFPKEISDLWESWLQLYGDSGLRNARGDQLLTQLTLFAMKLLKPKLIMINFNDPDYVHWGYKAHYTRGISIIDQGIQEIVRTCHLDPFYQKNTYFVITPDCGRDNARMASVPYQHHFGSKTSRELFALFLGPNLPKNKIINSACDQIDVLPTINKLIGLPINHEGKPLL